MRSWLAVSSLLWLPLPGVAQDWQERPDWAVVFREAGVRGAIAVADERTHRLMVHDEARSRARYTPASTFKIPHALFALDAGLVRDEFQVIAWDGVQRQFPSWNRDQDLRSSIRASTAWVYLGPFHAVLRSMQALPAPGDAPH